MVTESLFRGTAMCFSALPSNVTADASAKAMIKQVNQRSGLCCCPCCAGHRFGYEECHRFSENLGRKKWMNIFMHSDLTLVHLH